MKTGRTEVSSGQDACFATEGIRMALLAFGLNNKLGRCVVFSINFFKWDYSDRNGKAILCWHFFSWGAPCFDALLPKIVSYKQVKCT